MTHTSGLPGSAPGREGPANTLAEHVAAVSRATLLFEPGTEWNYSNIGIAALGRIIEVVTGQPYDRFLAERIFQPLEMKDTFFFVPPDKANRVASVYTYEAEGLKRVLDGGAEVSRARRRPLQHGRRYGAFPPDAA